MSEKEPSQRRLWLGLVTLLAVMLVVTVLCVSFSKQLRIAAQWQRAKAPIEELGGAAAWFTDYAERDVYSAEEIVASIGLSNTAVTDDDLAVLSRYSNLINISLQNTGITDAGLVHLARSKKLTYINLERTQVTDEGVAELRKALPKCGINY